MCYFSCDIGVRQGENYLLFYLQFFCRIMSIIYAVIYMTGLQTLSLVLLNADDKKFISWIGFRFTKFLKRLWKMKINFKELFEEQQRLDGDQDRYQKTSGPTTTCRQEFVRTRSVWKGQTRDVWQDRKKIRK